MSKVSKPYRLTYQYIRMAEDSCELARQGDIQTYWNVDVKHGIPVVLGYCFLALANLPEILISSPRILNQRDYFLHRVELIQDEFREIRQKLGK